MAPQYPDAFRLSVARMNVRFLFEAIEQGAYPDESVEGCFGVKMGDAIGKLVLGAWITLVKHTGVATHENITAALVAGSLPEFFETLVRTNNNSHYTHDLISRELFSSIPWDTEMLAIIGGKQRED
eukprot:4491487-Prymnesium_polylepis.1